MKKKNTKTGIFSAYWGEREREREGGGVLDWCLVMLVRWVDGG